MILTPSNCPEFHAILATPIPTTSKDVNYVVRKGAVLMEPVNDLELRDYLEGGEYDERMEEIEAEEIGTPINQNLRSTVLYLPDRILV